VIERLVLAVVVSTVLGAGAAGASRQTAVPVFGHAIVIVLENKEYSDVLGSSAAPTFAALGRRYAQLTGYYGVGHPSLPNYLALVSGSTQGITSDCTECAVTGPNLADTLEAAGKTWKAYEEGLPRAGFAGADAGRYAKKHNPFLYFRDVSASAARLRRIVPLLRFAHDERTGTLPDFALVVPDLCHDMHDCSIATGDHWLRSFLLPLFRSPPTRTAIFVVFDEGSSDAHGGGHVPALVLGPLVRPHSAVPTTLDHYSLLRTIEDAWGLPRLGRSATATPITGIWR
jgi:phosphatidylinositol-3-phosphatase